MSPAADNERIVLAREAAFRLGAMEIRPATREVLGDGAAELLEPRVMQVLVALHRAGGEVVTRDELTMSCWEGRVVSDDAINRVIARLRRLSERDEGRSFTLETITKVGYRLLPAMPAAEAEPAAASAPVPAPPPRPIRVTPWSSWPRAAAGVIAVLLIAGLLLWSPWQGARVPESVRADYDLALQSMGRATAEEIARAISLLRGVVEREPDWAEAWGALAWVYYMSLDYTPPERLDGVITRARDAADRALALNPELADAAVVLASLTPPEGHWSEIEAAQLAIYARAPDSEALLQVRSIFLRLTGRVREASHVLARMVELFPRSPFYRGALAAALVSSGRIEEGERILDEALARWPRNLSLYFWRYWLNLFTGRPERALAAIDDVASRPTGPGAADFILYRTIALAFVTRKPEDISVALRDSAAMVSQGSGYAENAMRVAALLGDLDLAFQIADQLYLGRGEPIRPFRFSESQGHYVPFDKRQIYALFDISTRAMRRDPRYVKLMEELGLAGFWRSSGQWPDFCTDDKDAAAVCEKLRSGG